MDKNTIVGFVLMGLVLFLFTWLGRPSQEEIALRQRQQDSIARMHKEADSLARVTPASTTADETENDSVRALAAVRTYGELAAATRGVERTVTLENDSVSIELSTKGGTVISSTLKTFSDYQGNPVRLIRKGESDIFYTFVTASNRIVSTKDLYFVPEQLSPEQLRMTVSADDGASLSILYTLRDKYMLEMTVESKGFEKVLAANAPYLDVHLSLPAYRNEKSYKSESTYSGIAYEYADGSVKKMSTRKAETENVSGKLKWIACRNMFFSTLFYSPQGLDGAQLKSEPREEKSGKVKHYEAVFTLPLGTPGSETTLAMYTGPNDYTLLKSIDKELADNTSLSKIVDMGDWFRFINVWLVIPIFNFLEKVFSNYGIIILLLTLIIKLALMPFTYKSYLSTAKMKVLRPQVEAINEKYKGEDKMMERQRATMELYRRAGVNTLGGCLPMLLQMPFLVAMYQYFPTSINLRGESFLWARDLSSYDDVIRLGVDVPLIGDHISLFCLLMTITQIVYMKISQANTPQAMPGMKMMPYFMAVMLFVFLNQNASGLSYYYLLSMLITIVQTLVFRWAIDDQKLLAKLEANKKKPLKKSKFMIRLEEMQKQQAELQRKQARGK